MNHKSIDFGFTDGAGQHRAAVVEATLVIFIQRIEFEKKFSEITN